MTQRDVERYAKMVRMADDVTAAASERSQALGHMARMDQELPGIGKRARAWIAEQQAPDHGGASPAPPRGRGGWRDDIDAFIDGVGRFAGAAHAAGQHVGAIDRGSAIEIDMPKSGRNKDVATCAVVIPPEAVTALLDASPAVRHAAIVALLAALQKEMLEFFEP